MTTTQDYILCEDCGLETALHEFVCSEGQVWNLCNECNQQALEEEEEEQEDLGTCVSCQKEHATIVFMHLKNGNFELCEKCFEWADHEDDYGKEFQKPKEEKTLLETMMEFLRR